MLHLKGFCRKVKLFGMSDKFGLLTLTLWEMVTNNQYSQTCLHRWAMGNNKKCPLLTSVRNYLSDVHGTH